jgi:hypothetical protein
MLVLFLIFKVVIGPKTHEIFYFLSKQLYFTLFIYNKTLCKVEP